MKESDIRPKELMDRYLDLSLRDAEAMDRSQFVTVDCPACRNADVTLKFRKNGFEYKQCARCGSVFCSPRPSLENLARFYESSESSNYWANVFFPQVAEARRKKLFRGKAKKIAELASEKGIGRKISICDVGAGYGIFLEELKAVFPEATLHAVEPGRELAAICRAKGFETLETYAENAQGWKNRFDLVISSEVIEHVFSPEHFVKSLASLVKPGGFLLLTGLGYEGFDILILQENSKSIFPPHHINFLSVEGFRSLFRNAGVDDCRVWTPGVLDADIVLNSGLAPEFLKVMASRPGALKEFQEFLSRNQMSSHAWTMGSKPSE